MANTNQIAINWDNTKVRPLCDEMYRLYLSCKKFKQMADGQAIYGASNPIPNDSTLIADGSGATGDGRSTCSDAQATNVYNRAVDIINWFEGSAAIATNDGTQGIGNEILALQVNGASIF